LPLAIAKSTEKSATAAKSAKSLSAEQPGLAAAHSAAPRLAEQSKTPAKISPKKSVDKAAVVTAKPLTKKVEVAKVDPLAPLPAKHSGNSKETTAKR
jgi:hypothetical protein